LYEKRLAYENQKYTKLERSKAEARMAYENEIGNLSQKNDEAVDGLLNAFKGNLTQVQQEYEESKKTSESLKAVFEEKLTQ
jgi:hypothetical protein